MKLLTNVMLFTLLMSAVLAQVGSIDNECQAWGYDYGVAKYECPLETPSEEAYTGTSINWTMDGNDCVAVEWDAGTSGADAVVFKGGSPNSPQGYLNASVYASSGTYAHVRPSISHITFCGEENGNEIPEFGPVAMIGILSVAGLLVLKYR